MLERRHSTAATETRRTIDVVGGHLHIAGGLRLLLLVNLIWFPHSEIEKGHAFLLRVVS